MSSDHDRVVEQRGMWLEEFAVGTLYRHRPGRTVTEADNVIFSTLTMNPQPLHLDAAWSAQQFFGQRLVNSLFTLSTMVGLSINQLTLGTLVANLGFRDVTFPHPVFLGDTLYARVRGRVRPPLAQSSRRGCRRSRAHRAQPGRRDRGTLPPRDVGAVAARRAVTTGTRPGRRSSSARRTDPNGSPRPPRSPTSSSSTSKTEWRPSGAKRREPTCATRPRSRHHHHPGESRHVTRARP